LHGSHAKQGQFKQRFEDANGAEDHEDVSHPSEERDEVARGIESEAGWAQLADALPAPLGDAEMEGTAADTRGMPYENDYTTEGGIAIGDDDEDTASIIAALTGLRSEISSLLPVVDDEA